MSNKYRATDTVTTDTEITFEPLPKGTYIVLSCCEGFTHLNNTDIEDPEPSSSNDETRKERPSSLLYPLNHCLEEFSIENHTHFVVG